MMTQLTQQNIGQLVRQLVHEFSSQRVQLALVELRRDLLRCLLDGGFVPVVSPVAQGEDGGALNVNADDAALGAACTLKAEKLLYLTDVDGILVDSHNRSTLIREMDARRAEELLQSGLAAGGMAPKVRSAVTAVKRGVHRVVILDGRVEHALLLESISPKSLGTAVVPEER